MYTFPGKNPTQYQQLMLIEYLFFSRHCSENTVPTPVSGNFWFAFCLYGFVLSNIPFKWNHLIFSLLSLASDETSLWFCFLIWKAWLVIISFMFDWNYKSVNIHEILIIEQCMAFKKYYERVIYSSSRIVAIYYLMLLESTNPNREGSMYLTSNKYHIHLCIHSSNIIENLLSLRHDFMFCTFWGTNS